MQVLDATAYDTLIRHAEIVVADDFGPKVFRTPDGRGVKLFRRKRRFSSAAYRPYARRFVHAARRLHQRGIPTVEVLGLYRVPSIKRDAVVYRWLSGHTLREALASGENRAELLQSTAEFLALLHNRGIYFRGLHFGNILVMPDGRFGLIDVSEVRFARSSLWPWKRARNFRPIVSDPADARAVQEFGCSRFLHAYAARAAMSPWMLSAFMFMLNQAQTVFSAATTTIQATPR